MSRTRRHLLLLLAVLVATAGLGWALDRRDDGGGLATTPSPPGRASSALPPVPTGAALAATQGLRSTTGAAGSPYERAAFGAAWRDTDRNGCDTRNDVLRRDLVAPRLKPGTHGCVVLTGTLHDPYTGATLAFQRGADTSPLVQVDHVVALADAWRAGADAWPTAQREAFANDPLELLAVDGRVNAAKSDGAAGVWLPPATSSRCAYAARQVAIKLAWSLGVTADERQALGQVLSSCPAQPLPARTTFVLGPGP